MYNNLNSVERQTSYFIYLHSEIYNMKHPPRRQSISGPVLDSIYKIISFERFLQIYLKLANETIKMLSNVGQGFMFAWS